MHPETPVSPRCGAFDVYGEIFCGFVYAFWRTYLRYLGDESLPLQDNQKHN